MTRALRAAWPPTMIVMMLFFGAGLYYLAYGIPGVGYSPRTELIPVVWRDFGRQIDDIVAATAEKYGDRMLVVGMDRYAIASELAFYSHDQTRAVAERSSAHLFGDVGLMYERWFPARLQTGRTMLIVAWDPVDLAPAHLDPHVESLEPMHEGTLMRDGRLVRRYFYRIARGYR